MVLRRMRRGAQGAYDHGAAQVCAVRTTMVLRRGARGAQDHGREQGCARPIILRINFVLAHPCRRGKYAGRKLTPAVALTRNDDNREVQSTEKEGA